MGKGNIKTIGEKPEKNVQNNRDSAPLTCHGTYLCCWYRSLHDEGRTAEKKI